MKFYIPTDQMNGCEIVKKNIMLNDVKNLADELLKLKCKHLYCSDF